MPFRPPFIYGIVTPAQLAAAFQLAEDRAGIIGDYRWEYTGLDSSPYKQDMNLVGGATYAEDPEMGTVLSLDGVDDYAEHAGVENYYDFTLDEDWSIEGWFLIDEIPSDPAVGIISKRTVANNRESNFVVQVSSGGFLGLFVGDGDDELGQGAGEVTPGEWVYFACGYRKATNTIWIKKNSGSRLEKNVPLGELYNSNSKVWIGRLLVYPSNTYFKGRIGPLRIYRHYLDDAHLQRSFETKMRDDLIVPRTGDWVFSGKATDIWQSGQDFDLVGATYVDNTNFPSLEQAQVLNFDGVNDYAEHSGSESYFDLSLDYSWSWYTTINLDASVQGNYTNILQKGSGTGDMSYLWRINADVEDPLGYTVYLEIYDSSGTPFYVSVPPAPGRVPFGAEVFIAVSYNKAENQWRTALKVEGESLKFRTETEDITSVRGNTHNVRLGDIYTGTGSDVPFKGQIARLGFTKSYLTDAQIARLAAGDRNELFPNEVLNQATHWWTCDEHSGALKDCLHGVDLTAFGSPTGDGEKRTFNGVDQYFSKDLASEDNVTVADPFSFAVKYSNAVAGSLTTQLLQIHSTDVGIDLANLRLTSGLQPSIQMYDGSFQTVSAANPAEDAVVVVVYDLDRVLLYVDGVFEGETPVGDLAAVNRLRVGATGGTTPSRFFEGTLHDVVIFNGKALSASEISELSTYLLNS